MEQNRKFLIGIVCISLMTALINCSTMKEAPRENALTSSFVPNGDIPDITSIQIPSNAKVILRWVAGQAIYSETSRDNGLDILSSPNTTQTKLVPFTDGKAVWVKVQDGRDSNFGMVKNVQAPSGKYKIEVVACFATQPNGRGPSFRLGVDFRPCDNCQSRSLTCSPHLDVFGKSHRSNDGSWSVARLSQSGPPFWAGEKQTKEWERIYRQLPNIMVPENHRWVVGWCQFLGQSYSGATDVREGGEGYLAWMIVWLEPITE